MTQEQKAKAYDEALSVALETYKTQPMYRDWLEKMFPELAEPEDDRIRKALIDIVKCAYKRGVIILGEKEKEKYIAWLERQADEKKSIDDLTQQEAMDIAVAKCFNEQKHIDKVEPKFHEGDIIKPKDGGHEPWQIMQVDIFDKKYRFKDGYVVHFSQEDAYELAEQKPIDIVAITKDYFANTPKEQQEKDWAELKHLNDVGPDIEIPFGANDSELQEWSYSIPEGFYAEIKDNKVFIKKGELKSTDEEMKELLQTEYEKGRADAIAEEKERILGKLEEWLDEYISNLAG